MPQNAKIAAFTVSDLLREKQQGDPGRGAGRDYPPPRLGLKKQEQV